jgi:nitroreductase
MFRDLVLRNRSYRRFHEERSVSLADLRDLSGLARICPSGANLQPLRYVLVADREVNARVFPCLSWAGYLADWPGPQPGQRPSAYIVILHDPAVKESGPGHDAGIAAQTILLGAAERGLGGCMIGSINREQLRWELSIDEALEIVLVLAIGEPAERVVLEDLNGDGDIRYWRDESGLHHVPKRALGKLVAREFGD